MAVCEETKLFQHPQAVTLEDELSDNKIAKVGISARTLYYWKQTESFQGWVGDILEYYGKRISRLPGLAQKRNRFIKLCQLAHRMDQIIKERAADPRRAMIPGGSTGLIKIWTNALTGEIVASKYDSALTREYVALIRQIDKMGDPVLPPEPEKSHLDLSRLSPEAMSTLGRILRAATPSPAASFTA